MVPRPPRPAAPSTTTFINGNGGEGAVMSNQERVGTAMQPSDLRAATVSLGGRGASDALHAAGIVEKSTIPTCDGHYKVTRVKLLCRYPKHSCPSPRFRVTSHTRVGQGFR